MIHIPFLFDPLPRHVLVGLVHFLVIVLELLEYLHHLRVEVNIPSILPVLRVQSFSNFLGSELMFTPQFDWLLDTRRILIKEIIELEKLSARY